MPEQTLRFRHPEALVPKAAILERGFEVSAARGATRCASGGLMAYPVTSQRSRLPHPQFGRARLRVRVPLRSPLGLTRPRRPSDRPGVGRGRAPPLGRDVGHVRAGPTSPSTALTGLRARRLLPSTSASATGQTDSKHGVPAREAVDEPDLAEGRGRRCPRPPAGGAWPAEGPVHETVSGGPALGSPCGYLPRARARRGGTPPVPTSPGNVRRSTSAPWADRACAATAKLEPVESPRRTDG